MDVCVEEEGDVWTEDGLCDRVGLAGGVVELWFVCDFDGLGLGWACATLFDKEFVELLPEPTD